MIYKVHYTAHFEATIDADNKEELAEKIEKLIVPRDEKSSYLSGSFTLRDVKDEIGTLIPYWEE